MFGFGLWHRLRVQLFMPHHTKRIFSYGVCDYEQTPTNKPYQTIKQPGAGSSQVSCSTPRKPSPSAPNKEVTMTPEEEHAYLWKRRNDVKLRALTNRLYQQERQRIFEFREGVIKAASILASTVAFANLTNPEIIKYCAVAIAAGSICSLVFGFGSKARDSAKRSPEWAYLERDIEAAGERDFAEAQLSAWSARSNEIEAGEPAANRYLLELCYQRACEALGATPGGKPEWWERCLPPLFRPIP